LKELFDREKRQTAFLRYDRTKEFLLNSKQYARDIPDYTQRYIYVGLHLQPEATTSLQAEVYVDQLLAIERLRRILPNGWKIYVKENPMQGYFMRGKEFFQRLNGIPDVVLFSKKVNTFDLIAHSQLTATISGTLGWESITGGKNTIVFGNTWYQNFPGVHRYRHDMDVEAIAHSPIRHEDIEKHATQFRTKLGLGILSVYHDMDTPENLDATERFIRFQFDYLKSGKV
jgi:hypothetical protein